MDVLRFFPIEIKFDEVTAITDADLDSIKIAETIQLLRVGVFHHPKLGELPITKSMLKSMVKNFDNKVRGIDIAIDYKHESNDIAAAWFTELYLSEDEKELWGRQNWTPKGKRKLADKEFRYVSADFLMNYQDNETLKEFGPTLMGAGLTNRPIIKRMEPAIELGEEIKHPGGTMTAEEKKKLAEKETNFKKLLGEGKAIEAQREAYLAGDMVKFAENAKLADNQEKKPFDLTPEQMVAKIKELEAKLEKMTDTNQSAEEKKELAEKETKFTKLLSEGTANEAQREAYMSGDMAKFAENAKKINLSEKGSGGKGEDSTDESSDAQDKVLKLAEGKRKDNSEMDMNESIELVLSENPKLCKEYEKETSTD